MELLIKIKSKFQISTDKIIFTVNDINKSKSFSSIRKLKKLNSDVKFKSYYQKITRKNINQIAKNYEIIIDGSDNFRTRFLINDYCIKNKKILVSGAISKFDGHIYTFNFLRKNHPV